MLLKYNQKLTIKNNTIFFAKSTNTGHRIK